MINQQEVDYFAKRVKHFMELEELLQLQERFVLQADFKAADNCQILIENKISSFEYTTPPHPM